MGKLDIKELPLKGSYIITPNKYEDDRGSFARVFCQEEMSNITDENFMQVNHSITVKKGTVRGMHFQYLPNAEVKMVKCIKGAVLDVIVDIRENSPTFLKHHSEVLSADNMKMIYIPKGFAHGFQTLEENSELLYFHSSIYTPNNEGALNVKDSLLKIKWPLDIMCLSKKDKEHEFINDDFKGVNIEL
jgi:dTDP-4-dehydrorhamnose 3,5-epimerase